MKRTSLADLRGVLQALSLPRDHVYVIHSSMLKFGVIEAGLPGVMRVLREVLGDGATILMPAFTFTFGRNRVWDYHASKAETGALCEHFRKKEPGVLRTLHPFHSLAVSGPLAAEFAACDSLSSFGPGSPFALLYEKDAINISLGADFEGGATFLHHAEEMAAVPYRFYKEFPGEVRGADGALMPFTYKMFVREMTPAYAWDNRWEHVWDDLLAARLVQSKKLDGANVFASRIRPAHDWFYQRLKADPTYCAVKTNIE